MADSPPEALVENILALLRQGVSLPPKERNSLIQLFTPLFENAGIVPPTTDFQNVLQKAAIRAGWQPPYGRGPSHQQLAARGRKKQRVEDLVRRRMLVLAEFRKLPAHLRAKPASQATAQAIIGRIEKYRIEQKPPMTVRTIQEDIRFMRKERDFGI
jgi:hypothetical protein